MLLPVPYNFPLKVKQITPKGGSSEVILALDNSTLEITVLITTKVMADLVLKKNDPAYAAILWRKDAIPPGSGAEMFTVKNQNGSWVTIKRGPATEKQIATAQENIENPTEAQKTAWSQGYVFLEDYNTKITDVWMKNDYCESENYQYQIETIRHTGGIWETIPYGADCEAKIRNAQDKYKNSIEKPKGDLEAWSHGYSSHEAFKAAFAPPNFFSVNGPSIAGFVYSGKDQKTDLFTSSGLSPGINAWPVPVNLYRESEKIGQAIVTGIKP
jgi:hypothetical protein